MRSSVLEKIHLITRNPFLFFFEPNSNPLWGKKKVWKVEALKLILVLQEMNIMSIQFNKFPLYSSLCSINLILKNWKQQKKRHKPSIASSSFFPF